MRMPIRKPGKNARSMQDPNITLEKYNKLKSSLKRLLAIDRPISIKDVKEQAAFGDFSDNAAYSIAKGQLRSINYRILKIKGYLKDAIIIDKKNNGTVELGCTVELLQNNINKTYKILGSAEVDVSKGIISSNSPIGASLIGKRKGDKFSVLINEKNINFEIVDIQ